MKSAEKPRAAVSAPAEHGAQPPPPLSAESTRHLAETVAMNDEARGGARTVSDSKDKPPQDTPLVVKDPLDIANIQRRRGAGLVRVQVKTFAVGVAERPPKTFIRAHTDPEFSIEVAFVPSDPEKDIDAAHIISNSEIADELVLAGKAREALLTRIVTAQGQHKLWLVKLPSPRMPVHVAHSTALKCLEVVREQWGWVRWQDLDTGYVVEVPVDDAQPPPPVWGDDGRDPGEVMQEMVRKGFRDHVISDRDHPVYKLIAAGGIVA